MQAVVRVGSAPIFAALHGDAAAQGAVASDAAPKKSNPHFARLDANKDGFVSYQEARIDKEAAQNFALYDENRDGRLSEDEFLKLKAAQAHRRGGVYISDGAITSKVKLAVLRAKDLKGVDVHVETVVGVVRLTGEVDNAKQVARVEQLAARVKGVKKIENKLTIRPGRQ
jgi:osmotically-inducible protein OsmY